MKLNRRHKAALFLTLLAVGSSLVLGAGIQIIAGIVLLGGAFAWAFGSNSRLVRVSFVFAGFLLVGSRLLLDWNERHKQTRLYKERVAEFERKIPELAKRHPVPRGNAWINDPNSLQRILEALEAHSLTPDQQLEMLGYREDASELKNQDPSVGFVPDPIYAFTDFLPHEKQVERLQMLRQLSPWNRPSTKWVSDSVRAGVDLLNVPDSEIPGFPPEPFSLRHELAERSVQIFVAPGLCLLFLGLCLILVMRRQPPP